MKLTRHGQSFPDWNNLTLDELQNAAVIYIDHWTSRTLGFDESWLPIDEYREYIKGWLQNGHYDENVTYELESLLAEFCDYHMIPNRRKATPQAEGAVHSQA